MKKDLKLLMQLMKISQRSLKKYLYKKLRKYYKDKVIKRDGYLLAEGELPICFIAHMDTVWDEPIKVNCDLSRFVLVSNAPKVGIGADDRAGIFAILKILQCGFRPWILFLEDEEIGGIGAEKLIKDFRTPPDLKYIVELDRQGSNDAVFYSCDNPIFVEYIKSFGFEEEFGTFSDISIIAPAWGVAAVNLSIGYAHEHTPRETLYLICLYSTIEKCKKMIEDINNSEYYEYILKMNIQSSWLSACHCFYCNKLLSFDNIGRACAINDEYPGVNVFLCEDCYNLTRYKSFLFL